MTLPGEPTPTFETRRQKELEAELVGRARSWLPDWRPRDVSGDFAAALLGIVARIESEVTQRLAQVPEKVFLGFLQWLGVRGQPGLAARLPVVFAMTPGSDPVDAPAGVQMQTTPPDSDPVSLETSTPLRILPAQLVVVVAASPATDEIFSPPPELTSLEAPKAVPRRWQLASAAVLGATRLQLEPELGLEVGMVLVEPESSQRYTVTAVDGAIVSISPELGTITSRAGGSTVAPRDLTTNDFVQRLEEFDAFGDTERNVQVHDLYLGSSSALDVEIPTVIEVVNGGTLPNDAAWSFWGKPSQSADPVWRELEAFFIDGGLYLVKPAGAFEELVMGGRKSRWLKATRAASAALAASTTASELALRVNCPPPSASGTSWPDPIQAALLQVQSPTTKLAPSTEGVANTAPLVLDGDFYPLGREPRLFDAFYLGSREVFSKPAARASLHFTIGGSFSGPLAGIAFPGASTGDGALPTEYLVAGVGDDGKLYRMWLSEDAAGAPAIEFLGPTQPSGTDGKPLALVTACRVGAVKIGGTAYVTAVADEQVWFFTQASRKDTGKWSPLGAPPSNAGNTGASRAFGDTVVVPRGSLFRVYVVMNGELFVGGADRQWQAVEGAPAGIERLVAILDPRDAVGALEEDIELACVTNGDVHVRDSAGRWTSFTPPADLDGDFYPLVLRHDAGKRGWFGRSKQQGDLVVFRESGSVQRQDGKLLTNALSCLGTRRERAVAVVQTDDELPRPLIWAPFGNASTVFGDALPGATFVGGPLVLDQWALFPLEKGAVAVAPCLNAVAPAQEAQLAGAVILETQSDLGSASALFVSIQAQTSPARAAQAHLIALANDQKMALELEAPQPPELEKVAVEVYAAKAAAGDGSFTGQCTAPGSLTLAAGDSAGKGGCLCLFDGAKHHIAKITKVNGTVVSFRPVLDVSTPVSVKYYHVKLAVPSQETQLLPSLDTSALPGAVWEVIEESLLRFDGLHPQLQSPHAIAADRSRIVLAEPWRVAPNQSVRYEVVRGFGEFVRFEPTRPKNPELDWEYFNGKSWWKILGVVDDTANLLNTGTVTFCVPADLQPTDVVGRSNHWVRARLVSGNYGQETVTSVTKPSADGTGTVQTIVRDTDSLRPPHVLALDVAYDICCAIKPSFVLTLDNASLHDQSDTNQAARAVVELFAPLAQSLAQYGNPDDGIADPGGPALYLGFDDELSGGPIQILFLLEDGDDAGYPLRVEALVGERFRRVTSTDGTRGLSETGIISLSLGASPQLTSLFGRSAHWLRLRPVASSDASAWRPRIQGIYLNAAWAIAAETQVHELIGSSDGSPRQTFTLGRPPVLAGALSLRVREPLGDEEKADLLASDPNAVSDDIGGLPGPWVLWREVPDPVDWSAQDRVYALDSDLGTITFGDGRNGRIPPMGRDSVLAERYQRGGGEAANRIPAFGQINLGTPLQGVNGVVVPEGAAGGSDPQGAATVVRFATSNLSDRGRVLSIADFESTALQVSPDVAQVRATNTTSGVRMVIVMRGAEPRPSNALLRRLKEELLARALPSLAVPGALELVGPEVVPVRVQIGLTISDVEQSGSVSAEAAARVAGLLDPATGGQDGQGWLLGELPTDTDLAACLVDLASTESLDSCIISVQGDDGTLSELPAALGSRELIVLVPDGVSVACSLADTEGE